LVGLLKVEKSEGRGETRVASGPPDCGWKGIYSYAEEPNDGCWIGICRKGDLGFLWTVNPRSGTTNDRSSLMRIRNFPVDRKTAIHYCIQFQSHNICIIL
jgi:hypothetical protein